MTNREGRDGGSSIGPEDVLTFWLGPPGGSPLANATKWYTKNDAFDREIESRFGATLELASRGDLDTWRGTARERLALVIVLDQFSRNVYRGTPRAFAQDARACSCAREAMARGDERALGIIERTFLYMPLMHAEDVAAQRECVAKFEGLRDEAPPELRDYIQNGLEYARRHAEIVERFGRFPHRNAILGRTSSAEESAFLEQPGSSF